MKRFHDQFGVNPLDINKTTISGYAGYLFQQNLMKHKRIGQYEPNILPMYGPLKSASTGGLTMVTRHSADGKDRDEAPINSHLFPDNSEKGVGVVAWDEGSLYPSSMLLDLPYGPGYYSMRVKLNQKINTRLFTTCYDNYGRKLMNSHESQVIQYLSLVEYPSALRVHSTFHAGLGQQVFGRSHKKYVDLTVLSNYGEIVIIQYHDKSHYAINYSHAENCHLFKGNGDLYNMTTIMSDDQNRRYAKYLSENVPGIKITYKVYNECDFFHSNAHQFDDGEKYKSPKDYLYKNNYTRETVFKPDWLDSTFNEKFLLEKILNTTECDSGFVVVKKGAFEDVDDDAGKQFGFCLQRNSPAVEELGPQAFSMTKDAVTASLSKRKNESDADFEERLNKAAESRFADRLKNRITYSRKSFQSDQCLPVRYFKWLMKNRKLASVEILHYIHYESRDYHHNFIHSLLQMRHDIIQKSKITGEIDTLGSFNLKLLANSMYGYTMMEKCNYFKYRYAMEENIKYHPPVNATSVNLLSVIRKKGSKSPSLLYQLKYPLKDARISNTLHIGATILGNSRVIFYDHIYKLLTMLDPKKAELCYLDTDSVFFFVSSPEITSCIKEGQSQMFENEKSNIFGNPSSPHTQAGKLKMEGYYQAGIFRSVKNYILVPFDEKEPSLVKSKGMPKIIRNKMTVDSFHIKPRHQDKDSSGDDDQKSKKRKLQSDAEEFYQHYSLNPTMGEQIFIEIKRRKMSNALNCKRYLSEVRVSLILQLSLVF